MKILKSIFLTALIGLLSFTTLFAQYEKEWIETLSEEDREQLEAIAMYPEETRQDILEVAQFPQAIIKLKRIQSQTRNSFQEILNNNSQEEQKAIWDLTRYPGLIEQLAGSNANERKAILQQYPKVAHNRANYVSQEFPDVLIEIRDLQISIQQTVDQVLADYPGKTRMALERLVDLPEVLSLLSDNIDLTMIMGDLYKKDPGWVSHKVDSLNLALARNNAEELEDWKKSVKDNPEATTEMQVVAQNFEEEYGYDDEYYSNIPDDVYYEEEEEDYVVEHHYYNHYPYWYGYPYWYSYPRWRPFPWWYEWGFYHRPGFGITIIGLPSHFSINWYFGYGYHHYYHPYFSSHLVNHYYGHRHGHSSITHGVHHWRNQNRDIVHDSWLSKKEGRVDRFRELGRFEADRTVYNRDRTKKELSKSEYFNKNKTRYPNLDYQKREGPSKVKVRTKPVPKPKVNTKPKTKDKVVRPKTKDKVVRPKTKDKVVRPKTKQPKLKVPMKKPSAKKRPIIIPQKQRKSKINVPKTRKRKPNIPKIKRSKDFHKSTWDKRRKN